MKVLITRLLFTGALNRRGTAEASFRFPAGLAGNFPLRYVVDTAIGSTEFTQQVKLEDLKKILPEQVLIGNDNHKDNHKKTKRGKRQVAETNRPKSKA